jgi:hypothetical protein
MKKEDFSAAIGFLKPGWWIIHTLGIAGVYILGNILWR